MRISQLLSEVSRAEKLRQKRAAAQAAKESPPVPDVADKRTANRAEIERGRQTVRQQAQQAPEVPPEQGLLGNLAGDVDMTQYTHVDEPEISNAVYLRFHTVPNAPNMSLYWVKNLTMDFADAKALDLSSTIPATSADFFKTLGQLERRYDYIHLIFDKKNLSDNPDFFKKLHFYLKNNVEATDTFSWEYDPGVPSKRDVPDVSTINTPKTSTFKITPELEQSFTSFFRQHTDLAKKMGQVDRAQQPAVRKSIMQVLQDFEDDFESAVPEVNKILNSVVK